MMQSRPRHAAVVGTFDGVHKGHRFLLDELTRMARENDMQPRVYTFPDHPLQVIAPSRAPSMITTLAEKVSLLEAIVPDVKLLDFSSVRHLTAREFMEMLVKDGVSLLVVGHDNRFGSDGLHTVGQFVETANGLDITIIGATELVDEQGNEINSTMVRTCLDGGDVRRAAELLGRPYRLSGEVVSGQQLGRTIGFPTANLHPDPDERKVVPGNGVYACRAHVAEGTYPAMVNIGNRPSVDSPGAARSIEGHLIGFDGDLYGKELTLEFIRRLRDEQKFPSLPDLQAQLEKDRIETERILQTVR